MTAPCAICRDPALCGGSCPYDETLALQERVEAQMQREGQRGYMPTAQRQDWETPPELFDALDKEFGPFNLDPAATDGQHSAETIWQRGGEYMIAPPLDPWGSPTNISGPAYSTATNKSERVYFDGLKMLWRGTFFLNPPYGREMPKWIERAVWMIERGHARRGLALIPARTDTKMWQRLIVKEAAYDRVAAHERLTLVRFLAGRVRFVGAEAAAPFPSAVVVWE